MKNKLAPNILLASLVLIQTLHSQTLTGDKLSIGSNNTHPTIGPPYSYSAVIGKNNAAGGWNHLTVGISNTSNGFHFFGQNSATIGTFNNNSGSSSLIIGSSNIAQLEGGDGEAQMQHSLISGYLNSSTGESSLIVGTNNQIPSFSRYSPNYSEQWQVSPKNSTLLGYGLITRDDNALIVGKNNLSTPRNDTSTAPLLVVANGTSTSARSNALEVLANGELQVQGKIEAGGVVTCAPGGDIPMFGN